MKLIEEHVPDLVLLDIIMPELDGYQVLAEMKGDTRLRNIPVIVISAIDELASMVECIKLGAADYLTKPFNFDELLARIKVMQRRTNANMDGEVAINELFDSDDLYEGPYSRNSADFVVGYNHGYRASWDCASGVINAPLFEDNIKAWSGDHCVDPRIVPGVFFCNRDIDVDDPALMDIAPTALRLFGVEPPAHMEGKPLFEKSSFGKGK